MEPTNDETPLTPAQMLALLEDQQRTVAGRMASFVPWILLSWGVAWLAGFLILWVDAVPYDGPTVPGVPAGVIFGGLLAVATVVSMVLGIRSGRGLRGTRESAFVGIVYGNMWWIGSIALIVIGRALVDRGMPVALLAVFFPSAYFFYAGVMYVMSGLVWRARPMVLLGIWSVAMSAVGAFVPLPTHYLFYAIAGGGAFLLVAAWSTWWVHLARRRVARAAGPDHA